MKKHLTVLMTVLLCSTTLVWAQTEQDFTDRIVNPSFETGDMTGWTKSWIDGDIDVRANSNGTYTVSNCDGNYLFNTWTQGDSYVFCCPNQFVEQELTGLPAGEYRLVALAASNTYGGVNTPVWLYANEQQTSIVPKSKTLFNEVSLNFFVDPVTQYVKIGTKSASWYKCDHFRLYYLGETENYQAHLVEGQPDEVSTLVEYWNGFNTDRWVFTKMEGHDHGNFPYQTNNMDVSQFEASRLNYWTGPANRLGDARITRTFSDLTPGWYEFRTQLRVYDENGDFDGTASGLTMLCGDKSLPITYGQEMSEGNLVGMGFYDTYSVIAQVGTDGNLTIGFETQNASFNWMTWVDASLLYFGDTKPIDDRYLRQLDKLDGIVEQASGGHEGFAAVYQDAQNRLRYVENDDAADVIFEEVRSAVLEVVKNYPATNGQYELTALIPNADMKQGTRNWTAQNATLKTGGSGVGYVENTRTTVTVSQIVKNLPAGHYTLSAQGFYRPTELATSVRNYEKGIEDLKASLFLDSQSALFPSQMDGRRFVTTRTSGMQTTMEGRAFPSSAAAAPTSFEYGDYWASVDMTLTADGDLPIGIRVAPTNLTNNCTFFGNFRLFYGDNVPDVTLTDNDTEYPVKVPTRAHVVLQKQFKAGTLTPLCLPFDVTAEQFDELYCVGSAADKVARLYPVSFVKAGTPFVAKMNETVEGIDFGTIMLSPVQPDTYVLPWNGGWLESSYIKTNRRESNYCWKFMSQLKGSTLVAATSMSFQVTEPQRMDFSVTLENFSARKFLSENTYFLSGASVIDNYRKMTPPQRRDTPNPVMVPVSIVDASNIYVEYSEDKNMANVKRIPVVPGDNCYIPNLYPQHTYYYRVVADGTTRQQGRFHTDGRLRMIYAPSANNIRDLGGWLTDDRTKRVKYGYIFRGSELNGDHTANAGDLQVLRDLGVGAEIDLRWAGESSGAGGISAFGFTDMFYFADGNDWLAEDLNKEVSINNWRNEWALTLKALRQGKSMYFHCVWGADRTGLWGMLLDGILGLSFDAIFKDYELTSYGLAGARYKDQWSDRISVIDALEGRNLTAKFENYFLNVLQIPQEEIDYFRSVMLEDVTMQPVVIDEDASYDSMLEGKTNVTLHLTLQPGQRNAVVLPFAFSSTQLRKLFGSDTQVETIDSYDGTELTTRKSYATTANVPFLITPAEVSDTHTYELEDMTLVRGVAVCTPFVGGRFCGNYDAGLDMTQVVTDAAHTSYIMQDFCFYKTDTTDPLLNSLHAYLVLDRPEDDANGVVYFLGETPTGIELVESEKLRGECQIYDLTGRRLSTLNTQLSTLPKGLYIINGKKVLLK